ncbi:MAG: class I SAM-dependent methyltransferase [Candidatus Hadarchaeota archaeon]
MSEKEVEKFVNFCNTQFGKELMKREAKIIEDSLNKCDRALSIGCGIGSIGNRINKWKIFYLDSSPQMIAEAKKRVEGPLILANAEMMPFKEKSFDCIYSVTSLEFIEKPKKVIYEASKILTSKGRFFAMMLNPRSEYFKSHAERDKSYFRKIKHHPKIIEKHMAKYFSTESRYILGIEKERIFETENPEKASLYVVKGKK